MLTFENFAHQQQQQHTVHYAQMQQHCGVPRRPAPGSFTVLQCPRCRQYWRKDAQEWKSCVWLSSDLAELCLAQIPNHPWLIDCNNNNTTNSLQPQPHPHFKSATQKRTTVYRNVIRVQVVLEHRPCCRAARSYLSGASGNSTPPSGVDTVAFPLSTLYHYTHSKETPADVREDFYFTVKYVLCDCCNTAFRNGDDHTTTRGTGVKGLRKLKQSFLNMVAKLSSCHTKLPPDSRCAVAKSCSASNFGALNVDCCEEILPYLPVRDLNSLSRVSHFWAFKVQPELKQFSRFLEAWNDSTTQGVYVNLDGYYPKRAVTSANVNMGGYLQSIPAEEFTLKEKAGGLSLTVNLQSALKLFPSVKWSYARPTTHSRDGGSALPFDITPEGFYDSDGIVDGDGGGAATLPATLLRCLPVKHKRLLQHMVAEFLSEFEVVLRGTPVFSRGSILFPFAIARRSELHRCDPVENDASNGSGTKAPAVVLKQDVKYYGCHICYILSC